MKREVTIQKQAISIVLFMAVLFCGLLLPMINNKPEYSLTIESIMYSINIVSIVFFIYRNFMGISSNYRGCNDGGR